MKNLARLLSVFLYLATFSFAQGTQVWQQTTYDDFSKGTTKGVAVRSDGKLELAPSFNPVYVSPSTYIWSVVSQSDGSLFIGTGSPARVYHVMPNGDSSIVFEPKELQVQALAMDKDGTLFAATSPDGKIYKITPAQSGGEKDGTYSANVFFDPKTKYIWSLAVDSEGTLYAGTGDRGEIFRVVKDGEGSVFFKSDEAHIRTLAFDGYGNLIAGSDGSGLVYRISPAGKGFVLYSAPKKEITALAVDAAGNIYVSGVGEKHNLGNFPAQLPGGPFVPQGVGGLNILPGMMGGPAGSVAGGSDVYLIAPDGSPKRIWTTKDDIIYALAFDSKGRVLAGTGNKGRIIAIEKNGDFTDMAKATATQVTAFANAPKGGIYAVTSNLGKVFRLDASAESDGTFESDVFDAHTFSRWGRAEVRGSGNFHFFTRSGNVDNPDRNWSPWQSVDLSKTGPVEAPSARFIQWKIAMPAHGNAKLESVAINYLSKNVAPEVDEIAVQVGARFNANTVLHSTNDTVTINLASQAQNPANPQQSHFEQTLIAQKDKGSIAMRWAAHDANDDDLTYSIYYKGDDETRWKLLKDKITDKFYSWDASLLPDGGYTVRVVASDAPSHTPDEALTGSRESARFEVDTTPPRINRLTAKADGNLLHVTFDAQDTFSPITRAEYSLDAGDWQLVEPVGQISDQLTEAYDFHAPVGRPSSADEPQGKNARSWKNNGGGADPARSVQPTDPVLLSNEHVVVVRVYDRFDNVGIAKVVVK